MSKTKLAGLVVAGILGVATLALAHGGLTLAAAPVAGLGLVVMSVVKAIK